MSFHLMEAAMFNQEATRPFHTGIMLVFPSCVVESRPCSWLWWLPSVFQRLVEAAEEAHLKHEFDADLQVTEYSLS